jgi:16S rRNA (cytosine967-C5)-methyltransferase
LLLLPSVKTPSLLGHVVEVLDVILSARRPADAVVREFFRSRHYLGSSDRRFIAERTYDILRHHRLLTVRSLGALQRLGMPPGAAALPTVMLVAAHESLFAPQEPCDLVSDIGTLWDASVGETGCAQFVGALASAGIPGEVLGDRAQELGVRHSIPDFVAAEWLDRFGPDETEALCAASNGIPPVSIRANALKGGVDECRAVLAQEGIIAAPGVLSPVGLVLPKRINAQGLHSFRQGLFEMQDEGSQILSMLLEVRPGMTVLDACAGGGGKTLHLAAIMQNRGKIIALDVDARKLDNLVLRSRRAGVTIAVAEVVPAEAEPSGGHAADAVLIDAPCSGVGTFRRNPGAKLLCTEEYSLSLARRQSALLERYAGAVRPRGRLVYSTCTILRRENQEVVASFLSSHPEFSIIPAPLVLERQGVRCPEGEGERYLELLPHWTGTDGYFAAVMERS